MLIIFFVVFKEEVGGGGRGRTRREGERLEALLGSPSSGNNQKRRMGKKAFCKKIFIRTMATGRAGLSKLWNFYSMGNTSGIKGHYHYGKLQRSKERRG